MGVGVTVGEATGELPPPPDPELVTLGVPETELEATESPFIFIAFIVIG